MMGKRLYNTNYQIYWRLDKMKNKIAARNCIVTEAGKQEIEFFLSEYHVQGTCAGQLIRLGLYYDNQLVGVMTFGYPRYNRNAEFELLRLCYHPDYKVTGGSAKLFNHFIKLKKPNNIISYCNLDLFEGKVYETLGFTELNKAVTTYKWQKEDKWISDNELRKYGADKLIGTKDGKGTNNEEIMLREGWKKVHYQTVQTYLWDSKIDGIIYKITNLINNKIYIGQSKYSDDRRWRAHCADGKAINPLSIMGKAIAKYGKENFKYEVIDTASSYYELNKKECRYISLLKPEYNVTKGGRNLYRTCVSADTRALISARSRELWQSKEYRKKQAINHKRAVSTPEYKLKLSAIMRGRVVSQEVRDRISAAHTGKVLSEETKKKISIGTKGYKHTEEALAKISEASKKLKRTEEHKKKMSAAQKGRPLSPEHIQALIIAQRKRREAEAIKKHCTSNTE